LFLLRPSTSKKTAEKVSLMPELPLEIDVAAAQALLNDGPHPTKCLLLDCRTPEEHGIAAIAGAKLLPMQEITERVAELEPWRNEQIVVHCHHGMRSLKVTQWLREQGFSQATSMRGGIDAWSTTIDAQVPRY